MNLVTDRTARDVERWRTLRDKGWDSMTESERKEWIGEIETVPSAAKGMYTHNDLNRVESAVKALSARLKELGYEHTDLITKTDWTANSAFWRSDMARYLRNLVILREAIVVYPNTPNVPSIRNNLNYNTANDIEKILADIDDITTNITQTWFYTGEIISGEV